MNLLRKYSPLLFLLLLAVTVGWWSGYGNLIFKYDSVIVIDHATGKESTFTDARFWHDWRGQLCVSGVEGNVILPRQPVVYRNGHLSPVLGLVASLVISLAFMAQLLRWRLRRPHAPDDDAAGGLIT